MANGSLRNTSTDSKGTDFSDFDKPHKRACQKGKMDGLRKVWPPRSGTEVGENQMD